MPFKLTIVCVLMCLTLIMKASVSVNLLPDSIRRRLFQKHDYPVSDNEFARRIDSESRKKLERMVVKYLEDASMPGAALAVERDGEVLYANGFGWADEENATHYRNKFRIASVSKPITLFCFLSWIEDGWLGLEEKVFSDSLLGRFLSPNFTDTTGRVHKVTVRHLLTHSSGFPEGDIQEHQEMSNAEYLRWAVEAFAPLQIEPDTRYIYCNFGFFLLGRIVEVLTARPYADFIQQSVFYLMEVKGAIISGNLPGDRAPDEVVYYGYNTSNMAPYTLNLQRLDSAGG